MMKTLLCLTMVIATATALPAQSLHIVPNTNFASDFQTVPVMANVPGAGAVFQSYVALLNPTASSFPVTVTLYDAAGVQTQATISLAAGQVKSYENFLDAVFGRTGAGAVTFRSPDPSNRFIITSEVRTSGTRFSTTVPALEFTGTNSPSFVAGVTVSAATRTNVGCFNQSDAANRVTATVFDSTGTQVLGSIDLNLPAHAWGQTGIGTIVTEGTIRFTPAEAAVCYAVVVDNATADGRFISAAEYKP
jgi:hypothetical protein